MYRIAVSRLDDLYLALSNGAKLFMPVDGESGASYKQWTKGLSLSKALNTVRSAKDFFFPQVQNLVKFKMEGQNIEIKDAREPAEKLVVFGIRACDVRSFDILDRVFLSEPIDTCYKMARENTLIISLACTRPDASCFCTSFGIDATAPMGDVRSYLTEEYLYLEPITEKGKELINSLGDLLEECGKEEVEAQKAESKKIFDRLPLKDLKAKDYTENQLEVFNSPIWASLSEACLGCGACTFSCPTCQCYDIRDFKTNEGVNRFRCWDSCMYSDFTQMAHANPRLTQKERFRQRFMHKLVYYPANNDGIIGCVGCGRCLRKCPINMNIVKVMKALEEGTNE